MNIVHVVRQFYPALGGIESVVRELASAQIIAGHRVRIITLDRVFKATRNDDLPARDVVDGAEVVRVPFIGSTRYPIALSALKYRRRRHSARPCHRFFLRLFCLD